MLGRKMKFSDALVEKQRDFRDFCRESFHKLGIVCSEIWIL